MKIIDHVKGTSKFAEYRAGHLYFTTDTGLSFPIPTEDLDGASVEAEMKSMLLMRWIRKQVAILAEAETAKAKFETFGTDRIGG